MNRFLTTLAAGAFCCALFAIPGFAQPVRQRINPSPSTESLGSLVFSGAASGDAFGWSAMKAGDVNNDGYSDIIIGGFGNDNGGADAGIANVYFGGPAMDNIADVTLTGEASGDRFGHSVAGAGDVNNDGYDDVIVGAYSNDAAGMNAGRAYLYLGGPAMDNVADITFTGLYAEDFFGWCVAGAGDVNNDGYDDVAISATKNYSGVRDTGYVYLYFGGSGMDNIADLILTGKGPLDRFGFSVASAGDVNDDNYDDLIIGAMHNDVGGPDAGAAYVFLGGATIDNVADLTFIGEGMGDSFGESVAGGDVNGDGSDDVVVGCAYSDAVAENAGRAYIYFGGSGMDAVADVVLSGEAAGDYFGAYVDIAGDVNGDGFGDVIVGAFLSDAPGIDGGKAYLFRGSPTMDVVADGSFNGEAAGDNFGYAASRAGDVNNDGYDDLIIGAANNVSGGDSSGKAYLYLMHSVHHLAISAISSPQTAGTPFAITITAQDINNNTVTDFTGTVDLTTTAGTTTPLTSDAFVNGQWIGNISVCSGGTGRTITATRTGGTETGTSNTFDVVPPPFTEISTSLIGAKAGSSAWGDYDNDGDLDVLLTGLNVGSFTSKIYRNDGGVFVDIAAPLEGVNYSSVAWGDYDNDGDLDILLTGASGSAYISKIYRNDGGLFVDIAAPLEGVRLGDAAWGDYDNDGDLDILLTGITPGSIYVSKVYRNDGGTFVDIAASIVAMGWSAAAWGDYDNDGDLDILLTGSIDGGYNRSKIYRNDGGVFIEITTSLAGVSGGFVAWGDYDNDGDLDILMTGNAGSWISRVYRNDGGVFTDIAAPLVGAGQHSAAWGDYDNDGDLDILLAGSIDSGYLLRVYRNDGGVFGDIAAPLTYIEYSSVAWGDYDNDGDLDILVTGSSDRDVYMSKIYSNNSVTLNSVPSAPGGLTASLTENAAILGWSKATDVQTPQNGLTYNLRLSTIPNGVDVQSPMADVTTGYRRVSRLGAVNHNNSWTVKDLEPGTYYWGVQAIDNAFAGGPFAGEQSFTIIGPLHHFASSTISSPQTVDQPFSVTITAQDINNNTVTDFTGTVDFTTTAGVTTPLISGSFVNGQWTGNISVSAEGIGHTITATRTGGAETGTSNTFDVALPLFTDINANLPPVVISAAVWGDYDNDGDLDIAISGNNSSADVTRIYRNDGGAFTNINAPLVTADEGALAWGDFDNDNDLDLLTTGQGVGLQRETHLYRNNAGSFVQVVTGMTNIGSSAIAWGDYDSDGDLDALLTGSDGYRFVTKLYRNTAGSFSEVAAGLRGMCSGSADFVDYDNDGDLDIMISGSAEVAYYDIVTKLYRNTNGTFTEVPTGLPGVSGSTIDWADFDADGDLDLLIAGSPSPTPPLLARVYRNENGALTDINAGLTGTAGGFGNAWGDYDNDGDLDILLIGNNGTTGIAKLYNNVNGTFSEIQTQLPGITGWGSVGWGDYDADGDLDILLTGNTTLGPTAKVFRNNLNNVNPVPSSPDGLNALAAGHNVTMGWDAASDDLTPTNGLSYNLRVGTTPGGSQILSPMAQATTGVRRLPRVGIANGNRNWQLKNLPLGTYYWSVQAVDNSFAGGPFTTEQTFVINDPPVALNDTFSVDSNDTLDVAAPGVLSDDTDPNSDLLTASVVADVSHGILALNPNGSFQYIPATGYVGNDQFTYMAGDGNAYDTAAVMLNIYDNRPFAVFTAIPNPAACNQNVSFDATSSSHGRPDQSIVSYAWDFGDGNTGTGQVVNHAFGHYGSFTVALTVTDNNIPPKTATTSHVVNINQGNVPPIANAGGPYTVDLGNGITLNGTGSTDPNAPCGDSIVEYAWDIDNNFTFSDATGAAPVLNATTILSLGTGSHPIRLRVTDTFGATTVAETTLTVIQTLHHFAFATVTGPQSAGVPFNITITAQDLNNTTVTGFDGTVDLTTTAGTTTPLVSGAFVSGQWTGNISVSTNGTGRILIATRTGGTETGTSNVFDVNAGGLHHFAIDTISTPKTINAGFEITIAAKDAYDNAVTSFTGSVTLTTTAGNISPTTSGNFVEGLRTLSVSVTQQGWARTISVNDGSGHTGTSNSFDAQQFNDVVAGMPALQWGCAAWGDYDTDGDLDLIIAGWTGSERITRIYRNNAGTFADIGAVLTGVTYGSAAWGDYDNDGDLDLLLTGDKGSSYISAVYRNTGGIFAEIVTGLTGIRHGSGVWGDYDNDGDLDILLTGEASTASVTSLYRNDAGIFIDINAGLPGLRYSSAAWGDFDQEGDLDFMLSGESPSGELTRVYRNNGGAFDNYSGAVLPGVSRGSVAWGDFDSDSDLDIVLSGSMGGTPITRIYKQSNGVFELLLTRPGLSGSSSGWGDSDNDGRHDLLIAGTDGTSSHTRLYRSGSFAEQCAGLPGIQEGTASWGDYDNDGRLDVLLTGDIHTGIYRNNASPVNTAPTAPGNLLAIVSDTNVALTWGQATDAQTWSPVLTYNLRIGSTPGGLDALSPMSIPATGYRMVPDIGPVTSVKARTLHNLSPGTYYWSAQAIDFSFAGGPFATEQTFTIVGPLHHFAISTVSSPQVAGQTFSITITAKDVNNNTVTNFTGTVDLSTTAGTITPGVSDTFVNGQQTIDITVMEAGTGKTITATKTGGTETGTSNTFDVSPGGIHHFVFAAVSSPQTAGILFEMTITAQDSVGNPVTTFGGTVDLTTNAGVIVPAVSGAFVNGQRTEMVAVSQAGSSKQVAASLTGGSQSGVSNSFNVIPGALHHYALDTITSPQTAGVPFGITITAQDSMGNTVMLPDTVSLTTTAGTITPNISSPLDSGRTTLAVRLTLADTGRTITARKLTGTCSGTSNTFSVVGGSLHHFAIDQIASPQISGIAFDITLTAQDEYNNTATGFVETVALSTSAGPIIPVVSGTFIDGIRHETVRITGTGTNQTIEATRTGGTESGTSNGFDLIQTALAGVLANPCFETGKTPWVFYTNGSATFTSDAPGCGTQRKAHVAVVTPGTNVQLYQSGIALQPSQLYRLSFRAYSTTGHDLSVSLGKHATPYTPYGLSDAVFNLTTVWQEFSIEFTTSGFTSPVTDGRLRFWFAPYDASGDHFYVDTVMLSAVTTSFPPSITGQPSDKTVIAGQAVSFSVTATGSLPLIYQWKRDGFNIPGATASTYAIPSVTTSDSGAVFACVVSNLSGSVTSNGALLTVIPAPSNVIVNGGFEEGTAPWTFYTSGSGNIGRVSPGAAGSAYAGRISIVTPGTNVQLSQSNITLEAGMTYKLTFSAMSSNGHDMAVFLHQQIPPFTNYGVNNWVVNLTTGWSDYSRVFTTSGFTGTVSNARLRFWFAPYDAAGDKFSIDNVVLEKSTLAKEAVAVEIPLEFALHQNYPNPFNPLTMINYQLPMNSYVTLKVYDVLGQEVTALVDEIQVAGFKSVEFDASNVASGVYLYRIQAGDFVASRKLVVVK